MRKDDVNYRRQTVVFLAQTMNNENTSCMSNASTVLCLCAPTTTNLVWWKVVRLVESCFTSPYGDFKFWIERDRVTVKSKSIQSNKKNILVRSRTSKSRLNDANLASAQSYNEFKRDYKKAEIYHRATVSHIQSAS